MIKEVMKQALEALKNTTPLGFNMEADKRFYSAIEALEEALKQKQGEHVEWDDLLKDAQQIVKDKFLYKRFIDGTPLSNDIPCWMADFAQQYTTPQGCDECGNGGGYALYCLACAEKFVGTKEWVGLMDEDEIPWDGVDAKSFAKAIEAKLKEKNA